MEGDEGGGGWFSDNPCKIWIIEVVVFVVDVLVVFIHCALLEWRIKEEGDHLATYV